MNNDTKTGGFKSLGEFLVSARAVALGQTKDGRLVGARQKTTKVTGEMDSLDEGQGGFLVPEQWANEILSVALEESIVRSRATVLKTNGDSLNVRRLVDTSRASNIYGVNFYWTQQKGQISASGVLTNQTLGNIEMTPHKLVGGLYTSNELMADVDNFGNFMKTTVGKALAFIEDYYYIWGTGNGEPLGIMNAPGTLLIARTAAGGLKWEDIPNMIARMLPDSFNRAVFLMSPDALSAMFKVVTGTANVLNHFDIGDNKIFGRPILITEKASAVGTSGEVILADFSHYLIADRDLVIDASQHLPGVNASSSGFLTDETLWRIVLRVDGQPLFSAAITPKNGSTNTVSPFVSLTTHS